MPLKNAASNCIVPYMICTGGVPFLQFGQRSLTPFIAEALLLLSTVARSMHLQNLAHCAVVNREHISTDRIS